MHACPLRCDRCGSFHPVHPDGAKNAGVTLTHVGQSVVCSVCIDFIAEAWADMGPRAQTLLDDTQADMRRFA